MSKKVLIFIKIPSQTIAKLSSLCKAYIKNLYYVKKVNFKRSSQNAIIEFNQVGFVHDHGDALFHNLNYSITPGSFYFLTGLSGVGKTTLLRLIYCDLIPVQGSIRVFGKLTNGLNHSNLALFRQKMGLIFQDCRLIEHLDVLDNVALALHITGVDIKKARVQAKELLAWVGLSDHFNDFPTTLSDGQKQRAAIARAVITRPILLLADEPTGNVDEQSAAKLIYLFEELNKIGTTVIIATHNSNLVNSFSYPELNLANGQLHVATSSNIYQFSHRNQPHIFKQPLHNVG